MLQQNINSSIKIQQQASDLKHHVYLSASAGTGKTKTLVDRILRLLLNGVRVESILCITFTNVATNEMLERLRSRLEHWFIIPSSQLSLDIKALTGEEVTKDQLKYAKQLYTIYLDNFDEFRIDTLHAFCVKVLRQSHHIDRDELDQVKIIDDYTKKKLIEKAYEKAITLSQTKIEIDFAISKLAQKYDYNSLLQLFDNLLSQKQKLYSFINSQASIQDLINEQYKFYGADKNISSEDIIDSFIQEETTSGFEKVLVHEKEESLQKINVWLKGNAEFRKDNLSEYINCFLTKNMTPKVRLPFSKDFRDKNPNFIKLYKKEQQRVVELVKIKNVQEQAEFMQCVIIFLNQIISEYEELKEGLGYLEHDDLILKTLELFNSANDMEALLYSLNLSVSHVLIDEAQDLSRTQWLLIKKIIADITGKDDTIFIVGDYKQSIYGFQGAEPEYFLEINELYKVKFHEKQKPWQYLELTHSFRSKKEILEVVNKIFDVKFENNPHHIAIKEGNGKVQVVEYSYKEPEKVEQTGWILPQRDKKIIDKKQHNSKELADFVMYLLSKGAKAQDIMVLFRKRGKRVSHFVNSLKEKSVPISEINKIDFKQNLLILDLLSLIKFFLLPENNLNLAGLLKSPFFNFAEDDIFKIAYNRGEKSIWEILQNLYPNTASLLLELKEEYESNSLYQFYTNLLYTRRFILSMEYSENRQEIIELFLDKVLEFERKYQRRGQSFLDWINDNSQATTESKNVQGVNIITAHAAKGLQSPIVIIADASDSENLPVDKHFWHDDKLIVPYSSHYEIDALMQVKKESREKAEQESLRLFYVAMTRAENELYIFGNAKSRKNSWYSIAKHILSENFIQCNQLLKEKHKFDILDKKEEIALPYFLKEDYAIENVVQHQIASEKDQLYSDLAIIQGNFIHKILYDVPKIAEQNQIEYIKNLSNTAEFEIIPAEEVDSIVKITQKIVKKFPDIFYGDNVLSEISIRNNIDEKTISAKIDKLIVNEGSIDIVEIKTDKAKVITLETVPVKYKKQLEIYKKCVASAYPNKRVNCKILSFYQQKIIWLL